MLTCFGEQANVIKLSVEFCDWYFWDIYAIEFLGHTHPTVCWIILPGPNSNFQVSSMKLWHFGNDDTGSQSCNKDIIH